MDSVTGVHVVPFGLVGGREAGIASRPRSPGSVFNPSLQYGPNVGVKIKFMKYLFICYFPE